MRSAVIACLALALGCKSKPPEPTKRSAAPSASSSAPTKPASTRKPYEGTVGTVKGVIKIVGDDPPSTSFSYPEGCEAAAGTYGKLFRRGQEGQLADALVAVTEYNGWVPPQKEKVEVTIRNCAYSTRTIVLSDSQHIEIKNKDPLESYLPHLDGAKSPATNVAIPRGPAIKLYSRGRNRYWLRDQMGKTFMVAHVFHLPYATAQVTSLDGRYEIKGVPVGKAKLSVTLPQTKSKDNPYVPIAKSKSIVVKEGDNVHDIELVFSAEDNTPLDGHGGTKPRDLDVPKTSPSASAAPSASASSKP